MDIPLAQLPKPLLHEQKIGCLSNSEEYVTMCTYILWQLQVVVCTCTYLCVPGTKNHWHCES